MNYLKDIQIKQAKPREKKYYLNDGGGLYLEIQPNNKKIWNFRFTFEGKRKTTTFQSYPKVSLENARLKRNEYLDLIAKDINPISYKQKAKEIIQTEQESNFKNVMYKWLEIEKPKASKE